METRVQQAARFKFWSVCLRWPSWERPCGCSLPPQPLHSSLECLACERGCTVAFEWAVASFVALLLPVGKALTEPPPSPDSDLLLIKAQILLARCKAAQNWYLSKQTRLRLCVPPDFGSFCCDIWTMCEITVITSQCSYELVGRCKHPVLFDCAEITDNITARVSAAHYLNRYKEKVHEGIQMINSLLILTRSFNKWNDNNNELPVKFRRKILVFLVSLSKYAKII